MGTFLSKALRKTTDAITNASGGRALADYVGTKIAQKQNPSLSIPQTTSGKDALKSAGKVAGTIATVAAGGAGLSKALAKKVAKKAPRIPKSFSIPGQKKPVKVKIGGPGREIPLPKTWDEGGW